MLRSRQLLVMLLSGIMLMTWGSPASGLAEILSAEPASTHTTTSPTVPFLLKNKSQATIPKFVLKGVREYTFYNVRPGNTNFQVERGTYTVEYEACGVKLSKKIIIKGDKYTFGTLRCKMVKVFIRNDTDVKVDLLLSGRTVYRYTVPPGKMRIDVLEGKFTYTLTSSCGTRTGTIKMRAPRMVWKWRCSR